MAILKTENLTYTYSAGTPYEKNAVENVSLEINEGEIVGIIGHTGSGKSTLIQHFNGLLKPTSGRILFDGEDPHSAKSKLRELRFKVGLVFQYPEYQLFEETVEKDVAFGPRNMGLSEADIKKQVHEALELSGIKRELYSKSPFELSGGQKRRVAIAGVMAMKPKVLILDEPTAGLDPKGRNEIFAMLRNYHKTTKSTLIIVSHSMEDAASFADRILVMNKAKVFCFDTPEKVFSRAEELVSIGLDIPQITRVCLELRKRGLDIDTNIYTVEAAKKAVRNCLEAKKVVPC